jgi:hypothetical protein
MRLRIADQTVRGCGFSVTDMYPSPQRPGSGAFVCQQEEQLRRFGHTVDVINILGFQSKMNYLMSCE